MMKREKTFQAPRVGERALALLTQCIRLRSPNERMVLCTKGLKRVKKGEIEWGKDTKKLIKQLFFPLPSFLLLNTLHNEKSLACYFFLLPRVRLMVKTMAENITGNHRERRKRVSRRKFHGVQSVRAQRVSHSRKDPTLFPLNWGLSIKGSNSKLKRDSLVI